MANLFAGPSLADRERHLENKNGFRAVVSI